MSDEKDGPRYIATKKIPRVEVPGNTLDAVLHEMRALRAETANMFVEISTRFTRVEDQLDAHEVRLNSGSIRARTESDVNLKQDSALSSLITRMDGVEANQRAAAEERAETAKYVKEVRDTIIGVATNKRVLFVGKVLFALAVAYSGLHGLQVLP